MSRFTEHDHAHMLRALELAARGRFTTHPNPNVGCVIANAAGNIVGEGFHARAGEPHAEVHALRDAGSAAAGATAYVTLEPCSHFGRTPPCADALINAGLARVVVAMEDPFPAVAGRGIQRLRDAGIQVDVGLLNEQARALNPGFLSQCERGLPWLTVKLAASLDGRTALANGQSQWLTGPEARADVQLGRAEAGAILTGAGTVVADNPSLNVRLDEFPVHERSTYPEPVRQPARVIIDRRGEVTAQHRVLQDGVPVYLVRTRPLGLKFPEHVQELVVPDRHGHADLQALLVKLGELGIQHIWCEAGHNLAGALIQLQLVDELIVYLAPKLLGDHAQPLVTLGDFDALSDVPELQLCDTQVIGSDVKLVYRAHHILSKAGVNSL